jgi:Zn-finger nucleic acid-binding protein
MKPDEITIRHICPCCHYLMSDTEFKHIRLDECPRCNQRKLSEFKTQIRRKGKIKW